MSTSRNERERLASRAGQARRREAMRGGMIELRAAMHGLHYRASGMVTACGVRLDVAVAKATRFTADAALVRRSAEACEVCAREARR